VAGLTFSSPASTRIGGNGAPQTCSGDSGGGSMLAEIEAALSPLT